MIQHSPLQRVTSSLFAGHTVWIKRDDLLHPQVSGNKYRKLKYALAIETPSMVISMGGPWSNHLHALAYACYERGWPCMGLVRGLRDEHQELSATLSDCQAWGMQLHFVSRIDYRHLREEHNFWKNLVPPALHNAIWIAEGGRSQDAIRGLRELPAEVHHQLGHAPDYLVCACGTGTTLAGLAIGAADELSSQTRVIGISAVAQGQHLLEPINQLLADSNAPKLSNFELLTTFDYGGFAKTSPDLLKFCQQFIEETGIAIEPVYTGKMLFALAQLCKEGRFLPSDSIVAVHTGGLQGARSDLMNNTREAK